MVAYGVPDELARVVAEVRLGKTPRVAVRDLVRWFGFDRRGAKVNNYIRSVMQQEGVRCSPALDAAYPEEELVFSSVAPIVVVAPPPVSARVRERPHPIAVFSSIIAAQADLGNRLGTRLDAIERLVAYLFFAELASIRAAAGGTYPTPVEQLLEPVLPEDDGAGPPLSFGAWVELARKLVPLVPPTPEPVQLAARAFASDLGARVASQVVPRRNKVKHGSNAAEEWFRETEPILEAIGSELLEALHPLLECELVSVSDTQPGEREAYLYEVRVLHGAGPFFPRRAFETSAKLTRGWAHLLVSDGPPLRLAPGIAAYEDKANEQVRLFFARSLALRPGDRVVLQAVVGLDERKERLPQ